MIPTRYAARIVKPLWSPFSTYYRDVWQFLVFPLRNISIGRDHFRCSDDIKLLDSFLGKWLEMKSIKYRTDALKGASAAPETLNNTKTWIHFSREGDLWTFKIGHAETDLCRQHTFKLNKIRMDESEMGIPRKVIVRQEGKKMIERSQLIGDQSSAIIIVREVNNDTMTAQYTHKEQVIMSKTYIKQ